MSSEATVLVRATRSALVAVLLAAAGCGGTASDARRGMTARPFASSSPWNTPTPAGTLWFDTPVLHTWSAPVGTDNFRHWYVVTDVGVTWSSTSDPVWTFDLPAYSADLWHRTRSAATLQLRAPRTLTPQPAAGDRVVIVADPSGNYVEIWQTSVDPIAMTVTGPVWATGSLVAGLGVGDLATNLNAGVRASNFSWAAGLITQADVSAGKIDHALALALPGDMTQGGSAPVGPYRAPATAGNGSWPTGPITMGSKIGIPAGTGMPAGLSAIGVMVFDALQRYGAYVGDVCGGEAPVFYADGPSMGLAPGVSIDSTPFNPLVAFWSHGGSADMEKIGPLLRVADYQP